MRHQTSEPILAIDPGTRDLGYAVLAGKRLFLAGVLPLRHVARGHKLHIVEEAFLAWLRAYRAKTLVVEQVPERPLDNLAGLPALGRLLRRLAKRHRLKLASYSARTVRRTVVSNGWAGKREVAKAISVRFPDLKVHLGQDRKWKESHWQNLYDAVALALHQQLVSKPPSRSRHSG